MPARLLIITAVKMEAHALRRVLRHTQVAVYTAGIGAGRLPGPAMLAGISLIIVCGVAGALEPGLKVGDVILDDPDHRIADSSLFRRGRIHTATQIIASPQSKAQLFADTGCAAVDMEQAIIQGFAQQHQIPVIGLRAISDSADQTLDPAVVHLVDDLGRPKGMKIAAALVRRPALIRYLTRLNASTRLALNNLGPALVAVIDQLTQGV